MKRMLFRGLGPVAALAIAIAGASKPVITSRQADAQLPSGPLKFGVFKARFDPAGAFELEGAGWPALSGNWKLKGDEIELATSKAPKGCEGPGRYRVRADVKRVSLDLIADDCVVRRMILDRSVWSPDEEARVITPSNIKSTARARTPNSTEPDADAER